MSLKNRERISKEIVKRTDFTPEQVKEVLDHYFRTLKDTMLHHPEKSFRFHGIGVFSHSDLLFKVRGDRMVRVNQARAERRLQQQEDTEEEPLEF